MSEWSVVDREWLPSPYDPFQYADYDLFYPEKMQGPRLPPQAQHYLSAPSQAVTFLFSSQQQAPPVPGPMPPPMQYLTQPRQMYRGDNPREIRNKAEKQRRDKLNQSIAKLASIVPPVVASSKKINKTGVLRLTAHYLRAHQYVFGDSIGQSPEFSAASTRALLGLLNGFLLTTTYKGIIVVVSQNVNEYLGYSELDLLGQNIFSITHEDDRRTLRDQLMPRSQKLGPNGELLIPDEEGARERVAEELAKEKRRFVIRLKKLGQRSEPNKYVTCHVEGSLRKSDKESHGINKCCNVMRRARTRAENPYSSGNDVVFIGVVRPTTETFINESALESYKMEYRTRHSVDGEIIQCEQRISLVTGYMTHEVNGLNAMNFIHKDEVRWVIVALREMYNQNQLFGESCYRLMTKNGQFIYLRTRGRLDVDKDTRAVTSFVCTNTVVDEEEGKQLIKIMKEKFNLAITSNDVEPSRDVDESDSQSVPVEDPRQLEKVILHLVTNLPTSKTDSAPSSVSPDRLAIIPPNKERIVSSIEKIYDVIKTLPKQPSILQDTENRITNYMPRVEKQASILQVENRVTPYAPRNEVTEYITNANKRIDNTDYNYYTDYIQYSYQLNDYERQTTDPMLASTSSAGTKRPKKFLENEIVSKKKVVEVDDDDGSSPSLEALFDEAILNQEIENAIESLDQSIDPNFPDLLISKEVQDILGKIDEEQNIVI